MTAQIDTDFLALETAVKASERCVLLEASNDFYIIEFERDGIEFQIDLSKNSTGILRNRDTGRDRTLSTEKLLNFVK